MLHEPLQGGTYSLFGGTPGSDGYFRAVATVADEGLRLCPDAVALVAAVRALSVKWPRGARRLTDPLHRHLAERMEAVLAPYLGDVEAHRRAVPLRSRFRSALNTRREAYLAHMVEIELMRRIGEPSFRRCSRKLAFLPHCLRAPSKKCLAGPSGLDWVCKECSPDCGVRLASRALREAGVEAYIWMDADLKGLLKELNRGRESLGVLGMPLNANRCARWLGTLHETSFHLPALEQILGSPVGEA
jgi:hypothetical protein